MVVVFPGADLIRSNTTIPVRYRSFVGLTCIADFGLSQDNSGGSVEQIVWLFAADFGSHS
jgi:hypothetical protein